jgi:hypothetical protein
MTSRTIKQQGQLYGSGSATVVAKIDGVVVFDGAVDSINQPFPALPTGSPIDSVDLFSWEEDLAFAGTRTLEISVTGATLLLTDTVVNYCPIIGGTSSGPGGFGWVYLINNDGSVITDPLSNVEINGNLVSVDRTAELTGQWYWKVTSGSTLTATVNILTGFE